MMGIVYFMLAVVTTLAWLCLFKPDKWERR